MPKLSFGVPAMACRRCGCRMVTKVGRTAPMLICTDCGLPVDQRETAELRRKHVWGYITLVGLASIGGAMFLLASVREMRPAGSLEGGSDWREEAARESEGSGKGEVLVQPGALADVLTPATPANRGGVSAKPGTVTPQEKKDP